MWPSLIKKAKEGGLDVIETYVFWNSHEPQRRQVFLLFLFPKKKKGTDLVKYCISWLCH